MGDTISAPWIVKPQQQHLLFVHKHIQYTYTYINLYFIDMKKGNLYKKTAVIIGYLNYNDVDIYTVEKKSKRMS